MASLRREIDVRPKFSATTPHFLKIIRKETSRDSKLRIPKIFVSKHGRHLSKSAYLKLPRGSKWEVEVTRRNGEVWFGKGWPEFSEFYSLGFGHRLVFAYEGSSEFKVCILDQSNTEIDYPVADDEETKDDDKETEDNDQETEDNDEETKDDEETEENDGDSLEISEDFPPCPKTRQKSPLSCPRPPKKNRTDDIALQRANACKSENPSSFVVPMHHSYVSQNYVNVPIEFARTYLIQQSGNALLRDLDGRTWLVKFKYENSRALFGCGWLQFVRDNKLKVDDACVFILINHNKLLFKVVFFRTKEAANCPLSPGQDDSPTRKDGGGLSSTQRFPKETPQRAIALERAYSFKSENPFFRVPIQPSYIHLMWLPTYFTRRHLLNNSGNTILRISNGRTWSVELKHEARRAKFLCGWAEFARDNNLEVGDVCVFELINNIRLQFDVVFFRSKEAANCTLSPTFVHHAPKQERNLKQCRRWKQLKDDDISPILAPQSHKKKRTIKLQ